MTLFDIGTAEAAEHMSRGLATVDVIGELFDEWNLGREAIAESSPIGQLIIGIPEAVVTPLESIHVGLSVCYQCLFQIKALVEGVGTSSSVVVRGCLRAAMLGAAHVAYVLAPSEDGLRLGRARKIAEQEAQNLRSALEEFGGFKTLGSGLDADESRRLISAAKETLHGSAISDRTILKTVANEMEQSILREYPDAPVGVLPEHLEWMWRSYSGIVHALAWTDILPQHREAGATQGAGPGDLVTDFVQVASFAHQAFALAIGRLCGPSDD